MDILNISLKKRKDQIAEGLRPSWQTDEYIYQRRLESRSPSPARRTRNRKSWKCPDIHYQFEFFSKFGDSSMLSSLTGLMWSNFLLSGSDGTQITLSQSDKWLRQAKVIDGWSVTTTDTAIAFRWEDLGWLDWRHSYSRKISHGSIWLEYYCWREFLQELCQRKGLDMQVIEQQYTGRSWLVPF